MSALKSLLANLIDYAGLFPPANLPLNEVVNNYACYRQQEPRWMLARLIVPALKLQAIEWELACQPTRQSHLAEALGNPCSRTTDGSPPWPISALLPSTTDGDFARALDEIFEFNRRSASGQQNAIVDTVEVNVVLPEQVNELAKLIPDTMTVFAELPWEGAEPHFEQLAQIRSENRCNFFAKIRTGGVKPELIPTSEHVANFILTAKRHEVGFKATAGLHHPLRNSYRLTYEKNAPTGLMHGFLNVFLAACLIDHGKLARPEAIELLSDSNIENFQLSDRSVGWQTAEIDQAAVQRSRHNFAISFGSCSFVEPVEDLTELALLPTQSTC